MPFADLPALQRRSHKAAVFNANAETRVFFDRAQHVQPVTRLACLSIIFFLQIRDWLRVGLLLLFLNFVSERYEIFQETFDPGETISETFSLPALDFAYHFCELAAETLLPF